MVPIGLFLLFLTGVGPLFAWRRTSVESLRRNFLWPGIASLVLVGALFAAGMRHFYALISFGFCLFVALTDAGGVLQGREAIAAKNDMNLLRAMVELTHRNTRRYGGYLVHMGIVLMFIGFTGQAFNQNEVKELEDGRLDEGRRVRPEAWSNLAQGENDELLSGTAPPWRCRRTARCWARWSRRSASTRPAGRAPAKWASAAAAERRPVPEFRRHERRQPARRDSGLRLPAGLLDLDRRRWC